MAIQTIIVGCDLSEGSDQALARAIAIAKRHNARILLVHAQADDAPVKDVDNEMLKQLGEVSAAIRVAEAREIASRMQTIVAQGLKTDVISRIGPPGEVITHAANEEGADLIVVGTHGRTGLSRFLIGSVAAETIRHAACDVLVCRGTSNTTVFQRPLVATDFSPVALRTLDHVADVCAPDAPVEVVHAWQLPAGSWGATLLGQARFPWNTVRDAVLDGVKAQAKKLEIDAAALGRPIHVELVQGQPTAIITQHAERGGHDLIAVGAHGHRGVRRLLLGSVAESTIRHSPCSVLVVHDETVATKKK
jgi:nucleotide-binding universal stress UspA family protein